MKKIHYVVLSGIFSLFIIGPANALDLTIRDAINRSLINQPSLKSIYQDSDLNEIEIQAKFFLPNPTISGAFLAGSENKTEWGIEQDFSKWIYGILKGNSFDAQRSKTNASISKSIAEQIFHTKASFYSVQADQEIYALKSQILESETAALELVQKQFAAGNLSALDVSLQKSAQADIKLELEESWVQLQKSRRILENEMGGFSGTWNILEKLPEMLSLEPELATLESTVSNNFDVAILDAQIKYLTESQFSDRLQESIHSVSLGVKQEQENKTQTGPAFHISIPIWNQGQVAGKRQEIQIKKLSFDVQAKRKEVITDIRSHLDQLLSLKRQMRIVQEIVIPAKSETLDETLKHYNYMLKGVYTLLDAKQSEIRARESYIKLLRDYWVTRSKLELLSGLDFSKESDRD